MRRFLLTFFESSLSLSFLLSFCISLLVLVFHFPLLPTTYDSFLASIASGTRRQPPIFSSSTVSSFCAARSHTTSPGAQHQQTILCHDLLSPRLSSSPFPSPSRTLARHPHLLSYFSPLRWAHPIRHFDIAHHTLVYRPFTQGRSCIARRSFHFTHQASVQRHYRHSCSLQPTLENRQVSHTSTQHSPSIVARWVEAHIR